MGGGGTAADYSSTMGDRLLSDEHGQLWKGDALGQGPGVLAEDLTKVETPQSPSCTSLQDKIYSLRLEI
jgi:hypothetical protein